MAVSSRSSKASEFDITQSHLSNSESTMDTFVSCSVGTALLSLRERYKSELEPTEQETKEGITTAAKKERVYISWLNSLLAYEIKDDDAKQAIEYNLSRTKEPVSELDHVILHVKNGSDEIKEFKEVFPLQEVLALVWHAVNDDSRYPLPPIISGEAAAARAIKLEKDRELRLLTFFNALHKVKTIPRCHHGIRHEWVFSLNGSGGLHLIENIKGTLLSFIKEEFNKLFWTNYDALITRPGYKTVFLEWIKSQDPSGIFSLVDLTDIKLSKKIEDFLLSHGAYLPQPEIIKLYKKSFEAITFFTDGRLEHAAFGMAACLLNNTEEEGETERNSALQFIQKWILDEVHDLKNEAYKKPIAQFYINFQVYEDLKKFNTLLQATGKKGECDTLKAECLAYFKYFKKPFLPIPPDVTERLVLKIRTFQTTLDFVKKDTLYNQIENFFAQWFQDQSYRAKAPLYHLLLNDKTRQKIRFKDDEELRVLLTKKTAVESKDSKEEKKEAASVAVIHLSPYDINRIFLHAILVDINEWTPFFTSVLSTVFEFVKKTFDRPELDSMKVLKRDSYPKRLEDQINYLICSKKELLEEKKIERPEDMILLPEQAKTFQEWKTLLYYFSSREAEKLIKSYSLGILNSALNSLKKKDVSNYDPYSILSYTLINLPITMQTTLFDRMGMQLLRSCVDHPWFFRGIYDLCKDKSYVIEALDTSTLLCNYSTFNDIVTHVSIEEFQRLLTRIEIKSLKEMISIDEGWTGLNLLTISSEKLAVLFDFISEPFQLFLSQSHYLFPIISWEETIWAEFINWIDRNHLKIILRSDFGLFFSDAKEERQIQILNRLEPNCLRSLFSSQSHLLWIVSNLLKLDHTSVITILLNHLGKTHINSILKQEDVFNFFAFRDNVPDPRLADCFGFDFLTIMKTPTFLSKQAFSYAYRDTSSKKPEHIPSILRIVKKHLLEPLKTRFDAMVLLNWYLNLQERYPESEATTNRMRIANSILDYLTQGGPIPNVEQLCAPLFSRRGSSLFTESISIEVSLLKDVTSKIVNFAKIRHREWFSPAATSSEVPARVVITSGIGAVRREHMEEKSRGFSFGM